MSEQESESEVYRVDKGNQSYAAQLARKMASEGDVTIRRPPEKVTEASGQGEEPLSAVSFPHEHRYSSEAESESQKSPGGSDMSDTPSREEIEARLERTEREMEVKKAEVESTAQEVQATVEKMDQKMDSTLNNMQSTIEDKLDTASAIEGKIEARLEEFRTIDEKIESNTEWAHRFSVATLIIVSLILAVVSIGLGIVYNVIVAGGG
jgi:chromosome segregation ATPase